MAMTRTSRLAAGLAVAMTGLLLGGCEQAARGQAQREGVVVDMSQVAPADGAACQVFFRRDALGLSIAGALGPALTSIDGTEIILTGEFRRMNDQWLVVEREREEFWVPRESILLFKVTPR